MAERLGEALLDLDTDDRKFNQGVDRAEKRAKGLGRVIDDTGKRAAQLGKTLAIAAGASGAAALTAGIVGAVRRLEEMRKASAQVDQALKNSGNTASTSAKEIEAWADALENRTGRAVEEVMAISANLASFGFGREEFFRSIELADDMAAAWGGDLRQNLEGLARALDDPINGMAMLSKRGIKLTDDQKSMAAAFLDAGDKVSAQGVVFEALEAQVKGVAQAGFGGLTKALAQAEKVWETAFEDLVNGEGDAAALQATLIELMNTLSSQEFVDAAMGFASMITGMIKGIADFAIATHQAVRDLKDFFATDDSQRSESSIRAELAGLDKRYASAHSQVQTLDFNDPRATELGDTMWNLQGRMDVLKAELERRAAEAPTAPAVPTSGTITPPDGWTPGMDSDAADKAEKHRLAVVALIADLEHERDIVGLSAQEQNILNTIRDAGVDVMSAEGMKIRELITETDAHTAQLERMQEVYALLEDIGRTAVMGIVDAMKDGQIEGEELMSVLGSILTMVGQSFLNNASSGVGTALGDIFAGLFADGGLIPNGQFGIAGEAGPELVVGGAGGSRVLSSPETMALMGGGRGDLHLQFNASGLTEAEVTRVAEGAIDRFNRFQLPGRVNDIQADPHARG